MSARGGAAGSLEATGYELGTGLGITLFGVFLSGVFRRAIDLPDNLAPDLAAQAAQTIGDTYIVATRLGGAEGEVLIAAGKAAFSQAHAVLLTTSAGVIMALAVVVFMALAQRRAPVAASHHSPENP